MSANSGNDPSRHSNGSYPASAGSASNASESQNREYAEERPDVPTVEERIAGLLDRYPERCLVPVSETHGLKLRSEAVEDPETVEETVEVGGHEEITTYETVAQPARPHIEVVEDFLNMYERYRDLRLKLEKRERHEEPEEFLIDLDNSYSPEYQSGQYARLSAWERQLLGGEYPHGEEIEGEYEEPVTVLMGLTASAYREPANPSSGLKPICDHDREIRGAWTGSSGSVKRVLRYVLEDDLGLPSDSYSWWTQSEPHGGDGANADRSHSHPVIVLDAADADVPADAITSETFRPVLAKHVSLVDGATWDAHRVEETVEVRTEDEIESLSGYVAEYVACDPEMDLLERSDEYLMWAASQWATATQKYSRDRVATAATKADACHQEYVSEKSNQTHDHGETVVRSKKPGMSFECALCGSSFGIDQDCTLTEHRTAQPAVDGACAADGGEVVGESASGPGGDAGGLRSRWRDARGAAVVGGGVVERECGHEEPDTCPLCATETEAPNHTVSGEVPIPDDAAPVESVGNSSGSFRRPATWEPSSVVRVWSGEEESVGAPGGVEYAEVIVEGAGAAVRKVPERLRPLPPPSWLEGPEPWERHPVEESDVRGGLLPPPEIVAKEEAERCRRDRVTPKEWPDDWYVRRFGASAEDVSDGDRRGLDGGTCWRVVQIVRSEPSVSAVAIVGRLQLAPSLVEDVRELMETAKRN